MINVTKTYLPPIGDYIKYLEGIWERGWLTNHGELTNELERKLRDYLGVKHLVLVSNGTIALQIAIKALEKQGEIITTAFSYIATTSSIIWESCKPVFADIEEESLTIDFRRIEELITKKTIAILATHVYGNPCNVEKIQSLAEKYKLKVIYDGAHSFGTTYKGKSIYEYGDISTLSFHSTKLFHTAEGGAIVTNNDEIAHKLLYMRNFGHNGPEAFYGIGINGKMSELHSAIGLCVLPYIDKLIKRRKEIFELYNQLLISNIKKPTVFKDFVHNYSYYPIIFASEAILQSVIKGLQEKDIYARRYFYPSLNTLAFVDRQNCPVSENISSRVLCLPLYYELEEREIVTICNIINKLT